MPVSYVIVTRVKRLARTLSVIGCGGRGNGEPFRGNGVIVYRPGASGTRKRPSAPECTTRPEPEPSARRTRSGAASGRGAHCGSGGTRSTGQVGPATTRPEIPEWAVWPLAEPQATAHHRSVTQTSDFLTTVG
jgi:hypothetical protein